jgi:hypothetical protein
MDLPLGPLTVLVGPNAVGKSNVLRVFEFLADAARAGIEPTVEARDGYEEVAYRGGSHTRSGLRIGLEGIWSPHASESAPDEYSLSLLRRRVPGEDVTEQDRRRNLGTIPGGSKELLKSRLSRPRYLESHAPKVIEKAVAHGYVTSRDPSRNRSYADFTADLAQWK